MGLAIALSVLITVAWVAAGVSRRTRRRELAELRAGWGRPRERTRRLDLIADFHRSRTSPRSLDDRTWADLLMDDVFAALDRTESTLGQQVLYHRLRSANSVPDLETFERVVERMSSNVPAREKVQASLTGLRNPAGYDLWWLTQPGALESRSWHIVFPIAGIVMLLAAVLGMWWPGLFLVLVAGAMLNLYIRVASATRIGALTGSFRLIGPLLAAADVLQFHAVAGLQSIAGPLADDLRNLARLRRIAAWVGRDPIAMGDILGSIFEYLNLLFLLDANALFFGARELQAHGPALLRVIAVVGDVDAALSVASVRAGTPLWTAPAFVEKGGAVDLAGLRHPLVADAVPNSIVLGPPYGVLITGSNMSGKSTFVRTVGVNVVLAQSLNTCFASAYSAPVLQVRSCIGQSDDLVAAKSYYLVEVESVLSLVDASASPEPHLFLLDELFRGTNAVERIAAGEAVLSELVGHSSGAKPHVVIAATHDGELVDLLRDTYAAFHLTDAIGREGLIFEYRLRRGPATTRNAIALLRLSGAPQSVIDRALKRAAQLDEQRALGAR